MRLYAIVDTDGRLVKSLNNVLYLFSNEADAEQRRQQLNTLQPFCTFRYNRVAAVEAKLEAEVRAFETLQISTR